MKGIVTRFLNVVEWLGNKLPDPSMLFVAGALLVLVLSQAVAMSGWEVVPKRLAIKTQPVLDPSGQPVLDPQTGQPRVEPVLRPDGKPEMELVHNTAVNHGAPLRARGLLVADEIYWCVKSLVRNFINFPPLGVVLVGMLGIGVAERTGFFAALLKAIMIVVPKQLLTPTVIFLGINSSLATDAGYIILPPLAAALYRAAGRSPLAGIAACFAGVAAGFNANLLPTSLDPLLAGLTTQGAQVIEPSLSINPTCNWWFMIASTFLLTIVGWAVTAWFVEPRFAVKPPDDGGPSPISQAELDSQRLTVLEFRALGISFLMVLLAAGVIAACVFLPGWPLKGPGIKADGDAFDRWAMAIVPMIFFVFLAAGIGFGVVSRSIRSTRDVARLMTESMAAMAPILVLSFFAAQFIAWFGRSNLDKMLAYTGGEFLASVSLGPELMILAFILVAMVFNLLIASMSAKYSLFAPIFIPMLMLVGISPALTQCAYRIGDSVTNIITPMNAYLVIILVFMQRFAPKAGIGTIVSMMLPYTFAFTLAWAVLIVLWMKLGASLGPGGGLWYTPTHP